MLTFSREVIVERQYKVSLKEFMGHYYAGAMFDNSDSSIVIIYVHSGTGRGNMSYVFDVPYIKGMDLDEPKDVAKLIRKYLKHKDNS